MTQTIIFNSFRLLMHALITRLSVFGTYAVRMNIDKVQEDENTGVA